MINNIYREGELHYIKLSNQQIFEQITKLYHVMYFFEKDQLRCFIIKDKCIEHIYNMTKQTLYNILKKYYINIF